MTSLREVAASGFVRFPIAWLRLPLSPGAKCLLVHLCAAADETGASWYSFSQLSGVLQRSRASISGYVAELRDAGLVATERQRTANGFNYRLRMSVIGWSDLTAAWRKLGTKREVSGRSVERTVRQSERMNPSGSETISIKPTSSGSAEPGKALRPSGRDGSRPIFDDDLESEWRRCFGHPGDPHPARTPTRRLLQGVIAHAEALRRHHDVVDADRLRRIAARRLKTFMARRRLVEGDGGSLDELARVLATRLRTEGGVQTAIDLLDGEWRTHWRRAPSPKQLADWVSEKTARNPSAFENLTDLWRFENRALRAHSELSHRRAARCGEDLPTPLLNACGDPRLHASL